MQDTKQLLEQLDIAYIINDGKLEIAETITLEKLLEIYRKIL